MIDRIRAYLQLGRAQTYPADTLLVVAPLAFGGVDLVKLLVMAALMFPVHWMSFGENSLLDYTQGYDKADPSKSHHPLSEGRITVTNAMNALIWTKCLVGVVAMWLTFVWSPNPTLAIAALLMWFVWGTSYNEGLDKETSLGFVPICLCFAAMGAWGWFLSHSTLTVVGMSYLVYSFSVILFQIGWSGHLKDFGQYEKSNFLARMGARIVEASGGTKTFLPDKSVYAGIVMKGMGILSLLHLLWVTQWPDLLMRLWTVVMVGGMIAMMLILIPAREWDRPKELRNMSIMEIFSIFAPVPLMMGWALGGVAILLSLGYFYLANKKLWGTSHPKV